MEIGETEAPHPGPGEIRVRTHAVGLNPVDSKLARGGYPTWRYPFILGLDVAGVVDALGEGVELWRIGDRVFYHGDLSKPGGFAELAVTTAHTVAAVPEQMSFVQAASLPCAGLTAYHALFRRLHVRAGQTILVQAGAGGVGGFAIELARHAGLRVLTTCSARNADYVRALGADLAIDYCGTDVKHAVLEATGGRGVDAIVESIGRDSATRCLEMVAFNGGMACVSGLPDLSGLPPFTVSPSLHEVSLGGAHLCGDRRAQEDLAAMADELAGLVATGAIGLLPIEVLWWEQIPDGLDRLAEGHVRGKIVAQVKSG
jgi:NADPH:quinone reductase